MNGGAAATAWRAGPVMLRPAHVLVAGLALWVLAAGVDGGYRSIRLRLVREAQPPQRVVSVALPDAPGFTDPFVILIYRLRNDGPAPVAVTAMLDDEVIGESSLGPGESSRVDRTVRRARRFAADSRLTLTGAPANWILESAELANIHGFTRGAVEFLILPAAQPFVRPSRWLIAAWVAWVLCLALIRPGVPRRLASVHAAASVAGGLLLAAVAIAPLVTAFRLVLAPHTFLGVLAVVAAPHLLTVTARAAVWTTRAGTALARALFARRERLSRALAAVPWLRLAIATAFVFYAAVLWRHVGAYAGGADSAGYLNAARLLSEGSGATAARAIPGQPPFEAPNVYEPLGLTVRDSGELTPTYPIGLSLMIAGAASLVGWSAAAHVVMVAHALAGVLLTFWLARACHLPVRGASIAALMLATTPLYLFMSLTLMSDTPSLVWVTAGVLLAWRSRGAPWCAFAAGAAVGVAVLTRPTNILAMIPIAVCLGATPKRWLLLAGGGAPAALVLGLSNQALYGSPLTSGYVIDYNRLFDLAYVGPSLRSYVTWLPVLLTPIGVLVLGLPALARQAPRLAPVLLAWSLAFAGFYAVYFHTSETWWYLRFLLPAFPPFIVGALWVGHQGLVRLAPFSRTGEAPGADLPRATVPATKQRLRAWPRSAAAAALLAAFVLAHNHWWTQRFGVLDSGRGQFTYVQASDWAQRHLPADATVLAMQMSGTLFYYTGFPVVRWDHLTPADWRRLREAAAHGDLSLHAMLFPFEIDDLDALRTHAPGNWAKVATIDHVSVWQLQP